jgi:hypothetical protein
MATYLVEFIDEGGHILVSLHEQLVLGGLGAVLARQPCDTTMNDCTTNKAHKGLLTSSAPGVEDESSSRLRFIAITSSLAAAMRSSMDFAACARSVTIAVKQYNNVTNQIKYQ